MDKIRAGKKVIVEGDTVIVNPCGDIGIDPDTRRFIGQPCKVLKKTKAGLYLVEHPEGGTYSFALRNLDK